MSATWQGASPPRPVRFGPAGMFRALLRAVPLVFLILVGLGLTLILRLVERPLCAPARPVTPHITVFVCRGALWLLGIGCDVTGAPVRGAGAIVANHSSWLDIFVLNARKRIYFVSKTEVAGWPGIGALARATGTVFIERNRTQAALQARLFRDRLAVGHKLLFFPEGTSTDNRRVLPFKSTLFAAFFDPTLSRSLVVQPVSLRYVAPRGLDPRFHAWWGDMDFAPHLAQVLAAPPGGRVQVRYAEALRVSDFPSRKVLASACEEAVRAGYEASAQF